MVGLTNLVRRTVQQSKRSSSRISSAAVFSNRSWAALFSREPNIASAVLASADNRKARSTGSIVSILLNSEIHCAILAANSGRCGMVSGSPSEIRADGCTRERSCMAKAPVKEIELHPDAWERFERAAGVVAKTPPQHRVKAKSKGTASPKKRVRKSQAK